MKPEGRPGIEWKNYVGEQRFTPARTFPAKTEADVASIVRLAVESDQRVHVAGAGHASSPLVRTDGFLIDTEGLSGARVADDVDLLPRARGKRHVRVLAGTRIARLNEALDELGLAMINLGSATCQSIAGAIATGTHGSGVDFGALADLVRSVDLVDGTGSPWRVEPAMGFTATDAPGVARINDDLTFRSVVVGVGVAGLLTSLVLEVREAFDLSETREIATWQALKESRETDRAILQAAHYELWINPYPTNGTNTVLVTVREEAKKGTERNPRPDSWFFKYAIMRWLIAWALDTFPSQVPWALDVALHSQATADEPHVDASYGIFDLGATNRMDVVATEWFFPMRRWKEVVGALLAEAERLRARPHHVGGVPFGVRFIKGSQQLLAMTYGEDDIFCAIELPLYALEHDRRTLLSHYERIATREGGRPHWGQLHRGRPGKLASRYPQIAAWHSVRDELDPEEVFANRCSCEGGLTRKRVPNPVIGPVDLYDASMTRKVLRVGYDGSGPVLVDRRRFEVHARASDFVRAFQQTLLEPGALIARRFEVLRVADRVGEPFVLGERFQGRFALDHQLLQDSLPHPASWTGALRVLGVQWLLQWIENVSLSDYGEVRELLLSPKPGEPYSIRYVYLTGTPFAGESHFSVEPLSETRCLCTEQLTFQPINWLNRIAMEVIGLRLHNQVVFGQVEAAADRLGVRYEPLDPDGTGTANEEAISGRA